MKVASWIFFASAPGVNMLRPTFSSSSRTDTFGLVNIDALACGVPVAAYPVPGPLDTLGREGCGIHGGKHAIGALGEDLGRAVMQALRADRVAAAQEELNYSWGACTLRFLEGIVIERDEESRLAA